jgi:asparagine synthase (glutamine-hydrolysing)
MVSACGRYAIAYNGEVYNFRELGDELRARGHGFRGHSDTEVLLAAVAEWGVDEALRRANGMFAFALWDRERRALTLARDRAGKKPLYLGWCGDTFLFGSELKALRAHPAFDGEIDRDALALLLEYAFIPAPCSIYRRIRKLEAGTTWTVDAAGERAAAYWSAREVAERGARRPFAGSYAEATDALDTLLGDAVARRRVADVPLGALLSGGIDSTTVVAMMQARSSAPVRTYTIGFREERYDESKPARAVAEHLGTEHTELTVTADDGLALVSELPRIWDEPFADASQIPTFFACRLARRDVTVALSGDGGDELFAGYKWTLRALRQWERYRRWPRALRRAAAVGLDAAARAGWRLAPGAGGELLGGWERLAGRLPARDVRELFARIHRRCERPRDLVPGAAPVRTLLGDPGRWVHAGHPLAALLHMDFASYLVDDVLVKVDRASMAASLEVRCPLLDSRVVELAWSLPRAMRVDAAGGKRILRDVLARYVPRELTDRPKRGFGVPVAAWLRGPLREWAEALLAPARLRAQGFLDPAGVERVWRQHLAGWRNHDDLLWSVLAFQSWLDAGR